MKIGLTIKEIRINKGIKASWLAENANVSRQVLHRIEKGENENMNLNTFFSLCESLDILLSNLLKIKEKSLYKDDKAVINNNINISGIIDSKNE